jgi:hypoxanthine phosphoribosyltransferase
MTITYSEAIKVHAQADCIVTGDKIRTAINTMAIAISDEMSTEMPLVVCVLNGGLIPMAQLLLQLRFPLETDYLHATRYGKKTVGTHLSWQARPTRELTNRTILVVDDIFDEGYTLEAICSYLQDSSTKRIYSAALLNKLHDRKVTYRPDFIGLNVEDRFLYGFGMDYQGYFRNIDGIFAVKDL